MTPSVPRALFGVSEEDEAVDERAVALEECHRQLALQNEESASASSSSSSSEEEEEEAEGPRRRRRTRGIKKRAPVLLKPWLPVSRGRFEKKVVVTKKLQREPRLGLNVEALQKDHAIIVDEFVESLGETFWKPNLFATVYDRLQCELDRVLNATVAPTEAHLSLTRDVQHVVSILFTLIEHERGAVARKVIVLKEKAQRNVSRFASDADRERRHTFVTKVNAGARLLAILTRTLLFERPRRKAFARWHANVAYDHCRAARLEARASLEALRATDVELHSKRSKVFDLEAKLVNSRRESYNLTIEKRRLFEKDAAFRTRRRLRRHTRRAFDKWFAFFHCRQEQSHVLFKRLLKRQEIFTKLALERWRFFVDADDRRKRLRKHRNDTLLSLMKKNSFFSKCLSTAFRVWLANLHWRLQALAASAKLFKRLGSVPLRRTFFRWRSQMHAAERAVFLETLKTRHLFALATCAKKGRMSVSFKRWRDRSRLESRIMRSVLRISSRRRLKALLAPAFKVWQRETSDIGICENHFRQCKRRSSTNVRRAFFRAWAAVGRDRRRREKLVKRIAAKLRGKLLIGHFRRWHRLGTCCAQKEFKSLKADFADVVDNVATVEKAKNAALAHRCSSGAVVAKARFVVWSSRILTFAYFKWVFGFRERRDRQNLALTTARRRRLRFIFDDWARFVIMRSRLRRMHARHHRAAVARSFATWRLYDRSSKHALIELKSRHQIVNRMHLRCLSARKKCVFAAWQATVGRRAYMVKALKTSFVRFGVRRLQAASFRRWAQRAKVAQATARFHRLRDRASARLSRRTLVSAGAKAFCAWRDATKRGLRGRQTCRVVLTRWYGERARLAGALRTWWLAAARTKSDETRDRDAANKVARKSRILGRCLRKRFQDTKKTCWASWAAFSKDMAQEERCRMQRDVFVDRCRRRLRSLQKARAFGRWQQFRGERQKQRKLLRSAAFRMAKGALLGAWATWRRAERQAERALDRKTLGDIVVRTVDKRRSRVLVGIAFRGWTREVADRRRACRVICHFMRHRAKEGLADALKRWSVFSRQLHQVEDILERRSFRLHRRTFFAWVAFCARQRHTRALLRILLVKRGRRLVEKAFIGKWKHLIEAHKERRLLATHLANLLSRCNARSLTATAFSLWRRVAHAFLRALLHDKVIRATRAVNTTRALTSFHLLATSFQRRTQARFFCRWRRQFGGAVKDREEERLVCIFSRHRQLRLCGRVYATWHRSFMQAKTSKILLRRNFLRALHRSVAVGFAQWKLFDVDAQKKRQLLENIRKRMVSNLTSRAMNAWQFFVAQRKFLRRVVGDALARRERGNVTMAFEAMVRLADDARKSAALVKRHAYISDRVRRKMCQQLALKAFNGWLSHARERRSTRLVVKRALRRFHRNRIAPAFQSWVMAMQASRRQAAAAKVRARECLDRVTRRMLHVSVARAFGSWASYAKKLRYLGKTCQRMGLRADRVALSQNFRAWVRRAYGVERYERKMKRQRSLMTRTLKRLVLAHVFQAFRSWQLVVRSEIALEETLRNNRVLVDSTLAIAEKRKSRYLLAKSFEMLSNLRSQRLASRERAHRWRENRLQHLQAAVFRNWQHLTILKEYATAGQAAVARNAGRHVLRLLETEVTILLRRGFDKLTKNAEVERVKHDAFKERLQRRSERRHKALLAIDLLNTRLLRKIYIAWTDYFKHSRALARLRDRVIRAKIHQQAALVMNAWRTHLQDQRRARRFLLRAVNHRARLYKGVALRAWCVNVMILEDNKKVTPSVTSGTTAYLARKTTLDDATSEASGRWRSALAKGGLDDTIRTFQSETSSTTGDLLWSSSPRRHPAPYDDNNNDTTTTVDDDDFSSPRGTTTSRYY